MRPGAILAGIALLVGCSSEPAAPPAEAKGTLTLTIDDTYPRSTATSAQTYAGSVTRTPTSTSPVTVTVVGAAGAASAIAAAGRYSIPVTLNPNQTNQLRLVATDGTGSVSDSLRITIRHDGLAPSIAQATPATAADNVPLSTSTILVRMSEPVTMAAGGGVRLSRQGVLLAGATTLSADSLTLTFTFGGTTLSPNAIYQLALSGITDAIGNSTNTAATSCFITTPTGATRTTLVTDPDAVIYQTNPIPTGIPVPDVVAARFAREDSLLSGVIQFIGPRTFSLTDSIRAGVFIDLDTDQSNLTGYATLKDTLFANSSIAGVTNSGTRAEYFIDLEPDPTNGGAALVVKYTSPVSGDVKAAFLPRTCGAFMAFVFPLSALGGETGNMNIVMLGIATGNNDGLFVDPVPGTGFLTTTLAAPPIRLSAPVTAAPPILAPAARRPRISSRLQPRD